MEARTTESDLPGDRARGRRGHPHAFGAAQSAARAWPADRCSPTCSTRSPNPASRATAVVVGPGQDEVAAEAQRVLPDAATFVQRERRGTAHAVLAAKPAIERRPDDILIVYGDTPLIRPATLARLRAPLADGAALAVLGFRPADPTGYGRLIMAGRRTRRHPRGGRRQRRANAPSRSAMAASWRSPATARLPSWSGSATTIANTNFI